MFWSRNNSTSYFEYAPKTIVDALDEIKSARKLTQPIRDLLTEKTDIWRETKIPRFFGLIKSRREDVYSDAWMSSWSGLMIGSHRVVSGSNKNVNDEKHSDFWEMIYELYCNRNSWMDVNHIREKIGATSVYLTTGDKNTLQNCLQSARIWTPEKVNYMLLHLNKFDPKEDEIVDLP